MSASIGELNFKVYYGLGDVPKEYCSLLDVHSKVTEKLGLRVSLSRNADTNALLSMTPEFAPASREPFNASSLLKGGIPAFLEMRDGDGNFQVVKNCNVSQLADMRASGQTAWAFYRDESQGAGIEPRQMIEFTQTPTGACRLRFDRQDVIKLVNAVTPIPDSVLDLVVKDAQITLISLINTKIMQNRKRFGLTIQEAKFEQETYTQLARQLYADAQVLEILWRRWAFRSPDAEAGHKNRTPRSASVYGD